MDVGPINLLVLMASAGVLPITSTPGRETLQCLIDLVVAVVVRSDEITAEELTGCGAQAQARDSLKDIRYQYTVVSIGFYYLCRSWSENKSSFW